MFEKYSNIFKENPSRGNRVVPCGRTGGRIDMMKLTVTFRNFANALKNRPHVYVMLTNKMHFLKLMF